VQKPHAAEETVITAGFLFSAPADVARGPAFLRLAGVYSSAVVSPADVQRFSIRIDARGEIEGRVLEAHQRKSGPSRNENMVIRHHILCPTPGNIAALESGFEFPGMNTASERSSAEI
jgi:hypothetical protein